MKAYKIKVSGIIFFLLFQAINITAQEFELVWSDEFDGPNLDTSIWSYEVSGSGGGNNELQYYTDRPENLYLEDGKLIIKAIKENYEGKAYTSARINSSRKFNFTYGKIEAYMKLSYGQGLWPAFWMLGEAFHEVGWPRCGEIDIMEQVGGETINGKGDNVIHSTLHWGELINGGHPAYGEDYQLDEGKFADDFHLVTTIWEDDVIRTYCDSVLFFTIDVSSDEFDAFDNPFFLILNLAVGGDWPGSPDATTVFPQTFEIDYVRLYKSKNTLAIEGPTEVYASDSAVHYSIFGADDWSYEWLLPEGASANGGIDSSFISLNWGCESSALKCFISNDSFEDTLYLPVSIKEPALEGDRFFSPEDTGLQFSFPELAGTAYTWSVPDDAEIITGQGSPHISVNWGSTSDSVSLEIMNACGTNNYSRILLPEGQYPYPDPFEAHAIPGTIESTEYDYGGEGIAYHDTEAANQGTGPRADEGVDTEYNDGSSNIGWITSGEWTEYTVQVAESGTYRIDVRAASASTSGISPLNIYFNGENRTGNITMPNTGSWSAFETVTVAPVELYETDTLMRLDFGSGGYNVGRITLSEFTPDNTSVAASMPEFRMYPNPVSDKLNIQSSEPIENITIYNSNGIVVSSFKLTEKKDYSINTAVLAEGLYFIHVWNSKDMNLTQRFIKQ